MGIISLTLTLVGVALIAIGVTLSLRDRRRERQTGTVTAEGASAEVLEGAAKLADALRDYPLGMQLIFVGLVLMLAGAGVGGVSQLVSG